MIYNPSFEERRKHPRIEKNIALKLSGDHGSSVTETFNISRSGAYCQVNQYIQPMTKVKVQMILPFNKDGKSVDKKVSCNGVLVRIEPSDKEGYYNAAIFFNDISQSNIEILSNYIENAVRSKP